MIAIGLMSGTSLDGVDAALVDIKGQGLNTEVKLLEFHTHEIPKDIKEEIKIACLEEESSVDKICSLNFKLGYLFSDAVKELCKKANISLEKIDFIASHGQTIYHIPKGKGNLIRSTLQIGEAAVIAYETNTTVLSNFRVMDIAAGGEGAPLVPFSEYILYGGLGKNIALQNIGGIGNVTVVPSTKNIDDLYAFDTGPGNMIIDEACNILYSFKYDDGGKIASSGEIDKIMLDELMSHSYVKLIPPKTTGREDFGQKFVENIISKYTYLKSEDIIATLTMFTAKTIGENYKNFILPKTKLQKIIIGGGGSHNKTLLNYIREELKGIEVVTQEDIGFSSDAKEAIAFVILGNETLHNSFSNVPSATNAKDKVILGNITYSPLGGRSSYVKK